MQMRLPEIDWQPVSRLQLVCWMVFYGLLLFYLGLNWGQLTFLDNVHLPIHEGGHLLLAGWEKRLGCGEERCFSCLSPRCWR